MKRRDFIKFTSTGLAVVAVGTVAEWPAFWRGSSAQAATLASGHFGLDMREVDAEMVDGVEVPMWAFSVLGTDHTKRAGGPRIPGPVLVALEGDRVRLRVKNNLSRGGAHGFAIPGVPLSVDGQSVSQVTIPESEEIEIEFTAPAAGTYLYLDPLNAPVNRVMGLHGALVVLPDPVEGNTPYSEPSVRAQQLFNDLGTASHFPGNPWDPLRNAVWVLNVIDPDKCAAASAASGAMSASAFLADFIPQYFTLNGKSGFFSAQHHHHSSGMTGDGHGYGASIADAFFDAQANISIRGTVGQPMLLRTLNAGLMSHSPHIHGNHVYFLSHANYLEDSRLILNNLHLVDTWTLDPGDIKDMLLPFVSPPDIPTNFWERVEAGTNEELFPLLYPMHDHNEISNTAAGGNYPQGIATHWQIDGPYDPLNPATAVISVRKAELHIRTGRIVMEGRCTVPGLEIEIHAGGGSGPLIRGRVRVDGNGRWSFRGRALRALSSRMATLLNRDQEDPEKVNAVRSVPLKMR